METGIAPEVITEDVLPAGNTDQSPETALETAKAKDDGCEQKRSYVLYIGNLNPKYSREVLCSMLKDILGTASVTLHRHDIEVLRKRKQACAFVQVATEASLEHILKQLLFATEAEQGLVKELAKKGKTLVVGPGKKFPFGIKEDREVRCINSAPVARFLGSVPLGTSGRVQ